MSTAIRQEVRDTAGWAKWWPMVLLPLPAVWFGLEQPAWVAMWLLAFAIYFAFKLTTLIHFSEREEVGKLAAAQYLLAWPGMDPAAFFDRAAAVARPTIGRWLFAILKTLLGIVLFWFVAPRAVVRSELLAGWIGLAGLAFMLHFGVAHLAALAWQHAGRNVQPLMNAPVLASSVSDFWSRRWNLAFRDLAFVFFFRPLLRRFGPTKATAVVFLVSGLIHDVVISGTARAGFGLPTLYFALQGFAVRFEKSPFARRWRLNQGWRGRLLAWVVVVPAAFWLFHPAFIERVVLPMMRSSGALS